jgi:putative MATE family efflux protein
MDCLTRLRRTIIGDRAFYRAVMTIVIPVIIQNSISNVVNLLDNVMVGQVGTAEMSGVAIANQLLFVFNLCIFGGLSGPSIFGAQFYGAGDMEGLKDTFRIKLWVMLSILLLALVVFLGWGDRLIGAYLTGGGDAADAAVMMTSAKEYLLIMLIGLMPFSLAQCYSGTLRETGETVLPMKASVAAVLTNLVGNWILIYGHLGAPALGVRGAAIATVFSRLVELGVILYAISKKPKFSFLRGVYRTLKVSAALFRSVMRKGLPLLVNEALWSVGMATLVQIYSVRGLMVLAGLNIASTVTNLFNVVFISMGNAVAVLIGQALGAGNMQKARGDAWKLIAFSAGMCAVVGGILAVLSPVMPRLYPADADVHALASVFILTSACFMPVHAITHCTYFTLRSGGSTLITFLFDSAFTWLITIPFALLLVHKSSLPMMTLFPVCQSIDLVKCAIGIYLVGKGMWVRNIVSAPKEGAAQVV